MIDDDDELRLCPPHFSFQAHITLSHCIIFDHMITDICANIVNRLKLIDGSKMSSVQMAKCVEVSPLS